jgi:pyridoxamine 5'-phosphate oxidase
VDLSGIRRDYPSEGLDPAALPEDPYETFAEWFADHAAIAGDDANAVVLATSDPVSGRPSARTVLLRAVDHRRFVFYTNEASRKGRELQANPQATLLFSWVSISRQIVIEGEVAPVEADESDAYFASRPRPSQIGAWASEQSRPIDTREVLETAVTDIEARFAGGVVPRPPHWGGFALVADRFEFWQGRPSRLHDRIEYRTAGPRWTKRRLAP